MQYCLKIINMENDDFLTVSIILFQLRKEEILETKTVFLAQVYAVFYVFCWSCKNIFAPKCSSSTVNNNKQISIFCCNYLQPSLLNYKFQVDKDYVQSSHYYASPTSRVNKNACGMNIFYLLFIKNSLYLQVIKSDFYLRNEFRNRHKKLYTYHCQV